MKFPPRRVRGPRRRTRKGVPYGDDRKSDPVALAALRREVGNLTPELAEIYLAVKVLIFDRDCEAAVPLLQAVLAQEPNFEPALRHLGDCLLRLNRRDEALQATQRALELNRSSENLVFHALMLLGWATEDYKAPPEVIAEALAFAQEAHQNRPDPKDSRFIVLTARLLLILEDIDEYGAAVHEMIEKFSDEPQTYYYHGLLLLIEGDVASAELKIKKGITLGLDPVFAQPALDTINWMRSKGDGTK